MSGWCFAVSPGTDLKVKVVIDRQGVQAYLGLPRPDVATHYRNPAALHSGFVARFRCTRKAARVSLVVTCNGIDFQMAQEIHVPIQAQVDLDDGQGYFAYQPLISVILGKQYAHPYFLRRSIESVLEQHYPKWQLVATEESRLGSDARPDKRILIGPPAEFGELVVFLNPNDELDPSALGELALAANQNTAGQLFYSNEDRIDQFGIQSCAVLKPAFDEDLFLCGNYLGQMIAMRQDLASGLDVFKAVCNWDLLVRAVEIVSPVSVIHIDKTLYHRRVPPDPPLFGIVEGTESAKEKFKVLENHIRRTGKNAVITEGLSCSSIRLKYETHKSLTVGVILRAEDGPFQTAIVKTNAGCMTLHVYQTTEGIASDLQQISEDIAVFINGPLECLNHVFFDELAAQASRASCGVVTGVSLNSESRLPWQMNVVQSITSCPSTFFAVSKQHVTQAKVSETISSGWMQTLADELSEYSRIHELSVLFTPFAVATFAAGCPEYGVSDPEGRDFVCAAPVSPLEEKHSVAWSFKKPLRGVIRALCGRAPS